MKMSRIVLLSMAVAQVWHYTIALCGLIGLLYVLFLGNVKLDATTEKLVYTMLGVLGTIVSQQSSYFYGRQRPDGNTLHDDIDANPTPPPEKQPAVPTKQP